MRFITASLLKTMHSCLTSKASFLFACLHNLYNLKMSSTKIAAGCVQCYSWVVLENIQIAFASGVSGLCLFPPADLCFSSFGFVFSLFVLNVDEPDVRSLSFRQPLSRSSQPSLAEWLSRNQTASPGDQAASLRLDARDALQWQGIFHVRCS